MASCTCENWTLKDLALALKSMHKDNKEIVVPMFQRGKRWKQKQEDAFIDSLKNSYPVGTMLFYRSVEGQKEIYTLVDGLQRGNTIKKFMASPTKYFTKDSIPTKIIEGIFEILDLKGQENQIKAGIINILVSHIQNWNSFNGMQFYPIAKDIANNYPTTNAKAVDLIIDTIQPFLTDFQSTFEKVANTIIPVIVYSGDEDSLPEIFDRINSKGTPLSTYEVYAASWPVNKRFRVENNGVVDKVLRKYDLLADDEFIVAGYDRDDMRVNRMLNAFEYSFGLSRYLNDKFEFLHFHNNSADDEINPLGFELVNACINSSNDKIKSLYRDILNLDINLFEKRLIEVIEFVGKIIAKVTLFKGNNRTNKLILHSKYQIMSMISTTFKEKYELSDLAKARNTWNMSKQLLEKNMIQHYVNDIIRSEWNDGGTSKIHKVAKPNKYLIPIPRKVWESTLNAYFEQNNMRQESKNFANPRKEDIVILNCIYLPLFTALDQLSLDKFDIEHIATKDQMKSLITISKSDGLPISSIANICYLPEKVNRSKGAKNFYQDINYKKYIDLNEVEKKYSFTKAQDLEWMDIPYNSFDAEVLKEYYMTFLNKRFKRQKEIFYNSLNIDETEEDGDFEEFSDTKLEEDNYSDYEKTTDLKESYSDFHNECLRVIEKKLKANLIKQSRSIYISDDNSVGVAISVSKKYKQGTRDKFWFAYRTSFAEKLQSCKAKYVAYGCESYANVILIPIEVLESTKHRLRYTEKNGRIHWHIVFYRNEDYSMTWQLSLPEVIETDLSQYRI